ncbi:alpha-ketoacid dehydrogenase subunit beta [Candidatus Woesearchaeota archaeon]|nr:alpha-ketoacid dehydrogenase subunit beta [Candidatus Woesearchaeota archaeon]
MKITMLEAINKALFYEMSRDSSVVVLGEDVGKEGGVFRATEGLQQKYGAERVVDTPLAEAGIVGSAIGMAINGLKPVCEIQFFGFIYPAINQIINHASRMRTRSRGLYTCPLVIRTPYGIGIKALEHHSESTESYFIHTPGLKVVIPSTAADAYGLLLSAIRDPDPVLFLEPTKLYRAFKEEVPIDEGDKKTLDKKEADKSNKDKSQNVNKSGKAGEYTVSIGKARIVQEGMDCTLISWGAMVKECEKAAELLAKEEIFPEIIDLRTVSPMDKEAILASVKKTGRAVIVQEAPRTLGLSSEISSIITENSMADLQAPVIRVTSFDIIPPLPKAEHYYAPDPYRIYRGVKKVLEY